MMSNRLYIQETVIIMKNVDSKIVKITGDDDSGFLMYVNGHLMWICETRQDVYD